MRPPIRAVVGNLVWNIAGEVWALYRVAAVGSLHESHAERLKVFKRLRSAFMRLPAQAQLLSIGETLDPFDVLASTLPTDGRMTDLGRDLHARTEAYLTSRRIVRRSHFLALRLDDAGRSPWVGAFRAGAGAVHESFGIRTLPSAAQVARCREQAVAMVEQLGGLRTTPVTAGEVRWLCARMLARGVRDVAFDASFEPRAGGGTASLFGPFREVRFQEGGSSDDEGRGRLGRYVRVDTDAGSSFHTCLVLSDMPTWWRFPGDGEFLAELESAAEQTADGEVIEADVSVRIRRVSNAQALKKTNRKRSKLVHQRGEYGGSVTGAPGSLMSSSASLDDLEQALTANRAEPELECTVIIHLADASLRRLERHAAALQAQFEPANYGLVRPIGDQVRVLSMMLPASPVTPPAGDYRQHLLARDLAGTLPLSGSSVGDDRGGLLGVNLDSGLAAQVQFEAGRGPRLNRPGNLAAVGEPGAGKSVAAKRLIELVAAHGGQVITIDRTEHGEYVRFADALAAAGVATQVIRLGADTGVGLDTLRMFDAPERIAVTVGFLSQLCGVETGSIDATTLAEAVEAVSLRDGRLVEVIEELAARNTDGPEAAVLARKLGRFARMDTLGRSVFGDGQPLNMSAGFVVFSAAGLDLVSRDTLENEHLARKMLDSQIAAQALLYLVAAVARRSTFGDRTRFAAALLDEFWGLAASPHGAALIREWLRDSRKHNAAVWLFSQHAADFDDAEIRSFLGTRLVFRQATTTAARAALKFLDVVDDDMVERLAGSDIEQGGFAAGTCLLRDLAGRVGLVQIHQSFHPGLRAAADTNPTTTHRVNGVRPAHRSEV